MPPHSKQFSIVADPVFTEANKMLDAFVKELRKSGKISGVVHKKAISKQQVEKLFQSGELGPATPKIQHSFKEQHGSTLAYTSEDVVEKISET